MAATSNESHEELRDDRLRRLVSSLEDNLRLIDELGNYPEYGARLADVIDGLRREAKG